MRFSRLLVTFTAGVLVAGVVAGCAPVASGEVPSSAAAVSVVDAFGVERATLSSAVVSAEKAISAVVARGVSTPALTALAAEVAVASKAAAAALPFEAEADVSPLGVSAAADRVALISRESERRVLALSVAVRSWVLELTAERERIWVAREKAVAGDDWSSTYDRVARIAAGLPFSFSFTIGSCDNPDWYACYLWDEDLIVITPERAVQEVCKVRSALAHEYRHQWQHQNGKYVFEGHALMNRDELEDNAYSFGFAYGC